MSLIKINNKKKFFAKKEKLLMIEECWYGTL